MNLISHYLVSGYPATNHVLPSPLLVTVRPGLDYSMTSKVDTVERS
jgi:hypothetical protein